MDKFKINDFAGTSNPEAQKAGRNSSFVEYFDRVNISIGDRPENNSLFIREKYRLSTSYKKGDNLWIWVDLELPSNFYNLQNGSMRLIGLWHNVNRGRIGLWIDSSQKPRLQIEKKDGSLKQLWIGNPKQIPVGRHQIALHIILGSLIELFVDGILMGSFVGDNMPYEGYVANQILFFIDGANAQTKTIPGLVGYEIGGDIVSPFVLVNPCSDLEFELELAKVAHINAHVDMEAKQVIYQEALVALENARNIDQLAEAREIQAQAAVDECKNRN
jgi:hypothetical protein